LLAIAAPANNAIAAATPNCFTFNIFSPFATSIWNQTASIEKCVRILIDFASQKRHDETLIRINESERHDWTIRAFAKELCDSSMG
jgi:hypothetical protein